MEVPGQKACAPWRGHIRSTHRHKLRTVSPSLAVMLLLAVHTGCSASEPTPGFALVPLPFHPYNTFDMGVVDFNGDGNLDLFTTNCNAPINLLENGGGLQFKQKRTEMGLEHTPEIPGFAVWDAPPEMAAPGYYVFFVGRYFYIQAHDAGDLPPLTGRINLICRENISEARDVTFVVTRRTEASKLTRRTIEFSCGPNGLLRLKPDPFQTDPMSLDLDPGTPLETVYLGIEKRPAPAAHMDFWFPDAHGMAWADVNSDGVNDVFISRGALLGNAELAPRIAELEDRLLLNEDGRLVNVYSRTGMKKASCPSRRSGWADVNGDGMLDLFYASSRGIPSRVYVRQSPDSLQFEDHAPLLGLDHVTHSGCCWRDLNMDGFVDLATCQNSEIGVFFGARHPERFQWVGWDTSEAVAWHIAPVDYDGDLDTDLLFVMEDRRLLLFENTGHRRFRSVPMASMGLPDTAIGAAWCDYDNDGLQDIVVLPGGLFRRTGVSSFEPTGLLTEPFPEEVSDKVAHIILSWPDLNNDGYRDFLTSAIFSRGIVDPPPFREDPLMNVTHMALFRNEGGENKWLEVDLVGAPGNRNAVGANVTITCAGVAQVQRVGDNEGSRASQGHYRLYFGLGKNTTVDSLRVTWPDGTARALDGVSANQILRVEY